MDDDDDEISEINATDITIDAAATLYLYCLLSFCLIFLLSNDDLSFLIFIQSVLFALA